MPAAGTATAPSLAEPAAARVKGAPACNTQQAALDVVPVTLNPPLIMLLASVTVTQSI
jgi:hypothetical protein